MTQPVAEMSIYIVLLFMCGCYRDYVLLEPRGDDGVSTLIAGQVELPLFSLSDPSHEQLI